MVNRPKQIGTAAETAVVRAARRLGFPNADRLTLTGSQDRGDIGLCPGVILEVKGGAAAKDASDTLVDAWLDETNREASHAGADVAFLVVQRRGVGAPNAHRWWAWWRLGWLDHVRDYEARVLGLENMPVRMLLADALQLVRAAGYGEPVDTAATGWDASRDEAPLSRARGGVDDVTVLRRAISDPGHVLPRERLPNDQLEGVPQWSARAVLALGFRRNNPGRLSMTEQGPGAVDLAPLT